MNEPKKIYISESGVEDLNRAFLADASIYIGTNDAIYISVNQLKDWITKNTSNEENQAGVKMNIVDSGELLKFIEKS